MLTIVTLTLVARAFPLTPGGDHARLMRRADTEDDENDINKIGDVYEKEEKTPRHTKASKPSEPKDSEYFDDEGAEDKSANSNTKKTTKTANAAAPASSAAPKKNFFSNMWSKAKTGSKRAAEFAVKHDLISTIGNIMKTSVSN
jgi:hypothetical protein